MKGTAPSVSVVIPCRNEADHIENALRSVLGQQSDIVEFEVIVADGMSNDGTRSILNRLASEDGRLRVIDNPDRIVSAGLNAGIRAARGRFIIRMDAHTEYASNYIQQCILVMEETGADNVGGPWVAKGHGYLSEAIAVAFQSLFAAGGARGHNLEYTGEIDTVYLGCWHRELFDCIGPFDEELVRNQDDEFNLRLTRSGGRIWQSSRIRSWYQPRGSLTQLFQQYLQYGYWKVRVIQKHRLPAAGRHLVPGFFVLLLVALPVFSLASKLLAWAWMILLGGYAGSSLASSLWTAAQRGWRFLPILPLVFACYHFGYGIGFLRGVWDFVLTRRGPKPAFGALTRGSARRPS
jgi:succinoglycan biosynthesis protein ExoA